MFRPAARRCRPDRSTGSPAGDAAATEAAPDEEKKEKKEEEALEGLSSLFG